MSLRQRAYRDRFSGSMGLARSFQCDAARTWFCLRDLRWQLAQPVSDNKGSGRHHTLSRRGHRSGEELLRPVRDAALLRARSLGTDGQHTSRTLQKPHGPRTALSRCHRRVAGLDVSRRTTRASEGLSGNSLGTPLPKEATPSGQPVLTVGNRAWSADPWIRPRERVPHIQQIGGRRRSAVLLPCCGS